VKSTAVGDVISIYPGDEILAGGANTQLYIYDATGRALVQYGISEYITANIIDSIAIGDYFPHNSTDPAYLGFVPGIPNNTDYFTKIGNEIVIASFDQRKIQVLNANEFPTLLKLDVGHDSTVEWQANQSKLLLPENVTNITNATQYYLDAVCSASVCLVPLSFNSNETGELVVFNLSVPYLYNFSHIMNITSIVTWNRSAWISVDEQLVGRGLKVSWLENPTIDLVFKYFSVNATASTCYGRTTLQSGKLEYPIATVDSVKVCDISPNYINITELGALPAPVLMSDDTFDRIVPIRLNNTSSYYLTNNSLATSDWAFSLNVHGNFEAYSHTNAHLSPSVSGFPTTTSSNSL
jgi:hypothetical protein